MSYDSPADLGLGPRPRRNLAFSHEAAFAPAEAGFVSAIVLILSIAVLVLDIRFGNHFAACKQPS